MNYKKNKIELIGKVLELDGQVMELKEELTFYKLYKLYVFKNNKYLDAEASGYADGDKEYEEILKNLANNIGIDKDLD